jgi:mRNA-degrading endonuclease RelE of RelBE toxin-antitoxin system
VVAGPPAYQELRSRTGDACLALATEKEQCALLHGADTQIEERLFRGLDATTIATTIRDEVAYLILIVEGAKADIRRLRAAHRSLVLDAIKTHLSDRPNIEEGDKKILRGLRPPWAAVHPVWQLTVVPFRVFYDVDEEHGEVIVNAVRKKLPGKTTEEIL